MSEKPLVLIAEPQPRTVEMIFNPTQWSRLNSIADVVVHDKDHQLNAQDLAAALRGASAIVGQIALPRERLESCKNLKVIFNVEGNFYPNVDYDYCFANNIRVLNISPVYAKPVAELALGLAISSVRDIALEDRRFRDGTEDWRSSHGFSLYNSTVGIIGLGDIGSTLRKLLTPFDCDVLAYDPWLPASLVRDQECTPVELDELMQRSRVIFILAGATSGNTGFIGRKELELVSAGSTVLVLSRAAVVDFEAFTELVSAGRFKGGTDVFPEEPLDPSASIRSVEQMILSTHRGGGLLAIYANIGQMVNDDLELVLRGLPPRICKRAEPETVKRMRSKPIAG